VFELSNLQFNKLGKHILEYFITSNTIGPACKTEILIPKYLKF